MLLFSIAPLSFSSTRTELYQFRPRLKVIWVKSGPDLSPENDGPMPVLALFGGAPNHAGGWSH